VIKPLTIAQNDYPINIIQGPLAGVSSAPFRALMAYYTYPAFACSEMISCKTLLHQSAASRCRFISKDKREGPVCFQLSGSDPHELGRAVRVVTDLGADLIDLNCGCPVKKIRRKGAGSSLLTNASQLYHLIHAMKQNTHLPVSIKIRVESQEEKFNADIVQVIKDSGLDYLIVHGRHWTEHYETPCRYQDIRFFVEQLKIPVIGNGDIRCLDSLKQMLATGCAGVMISRAGVGQPWLIERLMTEMRGEEFVSPSLYRIGEFFLEHVGGLVELLGNEKFAILHARKLAKYYARPMANKLDFCDAVNRCDNFFEFKNVCLDYFQ
jgi:tRNA-dihydrouridine synthase B